MSEYMTLRVNKYLFKIVHNELLLLALLPQLLNQLIRTFEE